MASWGITSVKELKAAYKALARPLLEYAFPVWDPHTQKNTSVNLMMDHLQWPSHSTGKQHKSPFCTESTETWCSHCHPAWIQDYRHLHHINNVDVINSSPSSHAEPNTDNIFLPPPNHQKLECPPLRSIWGLHSWHICVMWVSHSQ